MPATKTIALLGSTGYVGTEFRRQIELRQYDVVPIRRSDCNIYDVAELQSQLQQSAADCLINCAGYTGKPNVDACEDDRANCLAGNGVLPGIVATACQILQMPWGHVSSGCIFTGEKPDGTGFTEHDAPNFSFRQDNCSFYSGTKALGEEVLSDAHDCYIWRLRIPFSNIDSPRNYLSKLMRYDRLLEARNSLSQLAEFVAACLDCFDQQVPFGTYNLTNPGSVTTSDVVDMIRAANVSLKNFRFFASEEEFMDLAARTPRSNCVLDSTKAVNAGLKLRPVTDAIEDALHNWIPACTNQPS